MNKQILERLALISASAIIIAGAWFWTLQIGDVIELLRMAYGDG